MTTVVIMPGGFHPFHAGHLALYQAAKTAFPRAEVFVAATNDTSARPFPFVIKEKLAQLAGVDPSHFVQVKSPFRAEKITARFDPRKDRLIFVRSEKDSDKPPQPGGVKKDGSPSYLQPLAGETNIRPFGEHAYITYLPTVEFGPGMTSATEIRTAWPQLNDRRKRALVMSLYPKTQRNARLADTVVRMLDTAIIAESINPMTANTAGSGAGMTATYQEKYNQPAMENQGWAATYNESDDYIEEKWSKKYKSSINCSNPKGFSQRAHCAGRKKNEDVAEGLDKKEAILRIQKMLNAKYNANLDLDGVLGPLTRKSINKFMPNARIGLADEPNKTTAVQGKKIKSPEQIDEKCWDTHRQVGMKKKGSRQVPNCVPK